MKFESETVLDSLKKTSEIFTTKENKHKKEQNQLESTAVRLTINHKEQCKGMTRWKSPDDPKR